MRIKQDNDGNFFVSETTSRNRDNYNDSTHQNTADLFNEDKEKLQQCCNKLNDCIHNFDLPNQKEEPQDTKIPFNDCVSRGINAINDVASILGKNGQIIDKLKKKFKKTLILKKYKINDNEISNNSNKFFRSDEKYWKRIKMFGKHLFSTKATIKGKINTWFGQLVDYEGNDKHFYELIEKNLNQLFRNLKQHNENKQKKIDNNRDDSSKSVGLNTAFDSGNKAIH